MSVSRYPEIKEGTIIADWGPGWISSVGDSDGIDAVLVAHDIDMRPDGATVASIEVMVNDGLGGPSAAAGVELTLNDLMRIGNWAYDRAIAVNGTDQTAGNEVQYLQVTPVADDGESVEWVETAGDVDKTTAWAVYARVLDPSDGFVKAEFLREFALRDPFYQAWDEAKDQATRLAFLLSAGRWPIEVLDPRG